MTETPPEPTTPALSTTDHDAIEGVTWQVRVAAAWTWRLLVIGVGIYVFVQILGRIELVALSLVLALFLTAVLHPLERVIARFVPGPKSLSTAVALILGLAVLVGIGYFVVWQIDTHLGQLGDEVTSFVDKTRHWLQTGPLHLKSSQLDKMSSNITSAIKDHQGQLLSGALDTVRTVGEYLGAILLILLITFFLLRDGEIVWGWVVRLTPRPAHERLDLAGRVGWGTFGGYMRGQLIIAVFHGISVMAVLFALRIPLAAALGVLIFLGSFIPLVGLLVTGTLCVVVAMLAHGITAGVVVAVAIIVLLQVEAHLLQPIIMSRSVELHPLAVALSVITATTVAGIPGALVAVPMVGFLNTAIRELRSPIATAVRDAEEVGEAPDGSTPAQPAERIKRRHDPGEGSPDV